MVELFPSGRKSPGLYREKLCRTKAFVPVERPGMSVPLLTPAVEAAALEKDRVTLGAQHLPPPNRNQHRDWEGLQSLVNLRKIITTCEISKSEN